MILIAEDNPVLQLIVLKQLKALGLSARAVPSGVHAVDEVDKQEPISLILMDVQMPGMDGLEATKHIRRLEKERNLKRVPIIAVTGHAERNECMHAGMDDFYPKPVLLNELKNITDRWLPQRVLEACL